MKKPNKSTKILLIIAAVIVGLILIIIGFGVAVWLIDKGMSDIFNTLIS